MYQIWHKSPMRSILLFFDKFFQVPYLSLLQNLSQIWDKSPMSGIFFSGLRFHCTKYETNHQWVVFYFWTQISLYQIWDKSPMSGIFFWTQISLYQIWKKSPLIGDLYHIWHNENHWWFVSYLEQWKFPSITFVPNTL